jgi:hypothetical protein
VIRHCTCSHAWNHSLAHTPVQDIHTRLLFTCYTHQPAKRCAAQSNSWTSKQIGIGFVAPLLRVGLDLNTPCKL